MRPTMLKRTPTHWNQVLIRGIREYIKKVHNIKEFTIGKNGWICDLRPWTGSAGWCEPRLRPGELLQPVRRARVRPDGADPSYQSRLPGTILFSASNLKSTVIFLLSLILILIKPCQPRRFRTDPVPNSFPFMTLFSEPRYPKPFLLFYSTVGPQLKFVKLTLLVRNNGSVQNFYFLVFKMSGNYSYKMLAFILVKNTTF